MLFLSSLLLLFLLQQQRGGAFWRGTNNNTKLVTTTNTFSQGQFPKKSVGDKCQYPHSQSFIKGGYVFYPHNCVPLGGRHHLEVSVQDKTWKMLSSSNDFFWDIVPWLILVRVTAMARRWVGSSWRWEVLMVIPLAIHKCTSIVPGGMEY